MLLAMNGEHAALVKPFLGEVTAYASGLIFDRPSLATAHDLDGVRVVEIPWLLTPTRRHSPRSSPPRPTAMRWRGSTRSASTPTGSRRRFTPSRPDNSISTARPATFRSTAGDSSAKARSASTVTANSSRSNPPHDDDAPGVTGARAEALAARYLIAQGLAIVARNFRTRFGEIDLIARDRGVLVFVEVRMRRSRRFGGAIASITAAKRAPPRPPPPTATWR